MMRFRWAAHRAKALKQAMNNPHAWGFGVFGLVAITAMAIAVPDAFCRASGGC